LQKIKFKQNSFQNKEKRIKEIFLIRLQYPLNLQNPKTYNEKMQYLNLYKYSKDKRVILRSDKYKVREFLKGNNYEQYLTTSYGVWEAPEMINLKSLPNSFVLKANNSSGNKAIMFVKDKSVFKSQKEFTLQVSKIWEYSKKKLIVFKKLCQYHYLKIKPMIVAEEFLHNKNGAEFIDYKLYCFNGIVEFISAEEGKVEGKKYRTYYNSNWTKSDVTFKNDLPKPYYEYQKPINLDSMIIFAEKVSKDFPHIRVDLYEVNKTLFFGEITFSPDGCLTKWGDLNLDRFYGDKINLEYYKNDQEI